MSLNYIVTHTFLPPKLPQGDDENASYDSEMAQMLSASLKLFMRHEPESAACLTPAVKMLERMQHTAANSHSSKAAVVKEMLRGLETNDHAAFHLRAQNSGLLITVRSDDVLCETFELLAPNSAAMASTGALVREFPDHASTVPRQTFFKHNFLDVFVHAICKLDADAAPSARPKTSKAGVILDEERDTLSPFLVTGMLNDILAGLGQSVEPPRIVKRSREQVSWSNERLPFHRSAAWLLLRVVLRLILDRKTNQSWYKPVMAFHHSCLLSQATWSPTLESGLIFCMSAKIAHRIAKIDPPASTAWLREVILTVEKSRSILDQRWKRAQLSNNRGLHLGKLERLNFFEDSNLHLQHLGSHLHWVDSRALAHQGDPGPGDITTFTGLSPYQLPASDFLTSGPKPMNHFKVLELEHWIETNLPDWLHSFTRQMCSSTTATTQATLVQLGDLIDKYHEHGRNIYRHAPDGLSIMYLCVMELWVAMDTIAGAATPLLLKYNPNFPQGLLYPLLLETKDEMLRLQRVERYLSNRESGRYGSAFGHFGEPSSLAVQYFDSSKYHQDLRRRIEIKAQHQREEKIREYRKKRAEYVRLTCEHDAMSCNDTLDRYGDFVHIDHFCSRCKVDEKMKGLFISVHEWPLPHHDDQAKAVVFELDVSSPVKIWRDTTLLLLTHVFGKKEESSTKRLYYAAYYSALQPFAKSIGRLHPGSEVKPMESSHYRDKHISAASEENICVPHASRYSYHDLNQGECYSPTKTARVPEDCSFAVLATNPLFEAWIRSTGHTSNAVIASQANCPLNMPLEAFRAFGNLRAGLLLQWANILCHMVIPSLDFNKRSTYALVMQASLEAGPSESHESPMRLAHLDAFEQGFAAKIITAISEALGRLRESWQNDTGVSLLACLTTRVLHLASCGMIANLALGSLSELRQVTITWARQLFEKLNESNVETDRSVWVKRLLLSSLVCASTFDLTLEHLKSVLGHKENVSILVKACILIHDHLPGSGDPEEPISKFLLSRWRRIMHRCCTIIATEVTENGNSGLDEAVTFFWADYAPSGVGWQCRKTPQIHVLESRTRQGPSRNGDGEINTGMSVTFNILTGSLLVNGVPLSKLPKEYQDHPTFLRLFGPKILNVMPSTLPGMTFSSSQKQEGWVVHFSMKDGKLIIQAVRSGFKNDGASGEGDPGQGRTVWEFLPPGSFHEDLSATFVENYSHWIDLSSRIIQFRPVAKPWTASKGTWTMRFDDSGRALLRNAGYSVIEPKSNTATQISAVMRPIEGERHIDLMWKDTGSTDKVLRELVINLPRLSISFLLEEGSSNIRSKNYTGMFIDRSQCLSSLVGLENKLILRSHSIGSPPSRLVLVPRGEVLSSCNTEHVRVTIHPEIHLGRILYDSFQIDDTLGQLKDSGALESKLFLCLLHAVTSNCVPDPLTGRTGTEESLRILGSAAVRSFQNLEEASRQLLQKIANLSPRRSWYPEHLQVMERVEWSRDLPMLSQHEDFWTTAVSIIQSAKEFEGVFPTDVSSTSTSSRELVDLWSVPLLVQRAGIRNAIFRTSEYGAEQHFDRLGIHDRVYQGTMKRINGPSTCDRISVIARTLEAGQQKLLKTPSENMKRLINQANGDVFVGEPNVQLALSLDMLNRSQIKGAWCGLHRALTAESNKYQKIFFLATLLYAEKEEWEVVQALMAFSSIDDFVSEITPPDFPRFDLTVNRTSLPDKVKNLVREKRTPFEAWSCKWQLSKGVSESNYQFSRRQKTQWGQQTENAVQALSEHFRHQYSSSWTIHAPQGKTRREWRKHVNVDKAVEEVQQLVETARRSYDFDRYLDRVVARMTAAPLVPDTTSTRRRTETTPNGDLSYPRPNGLIRASELFLGPAPVVARPLLKPCQGSDAQVEASQKIDKASSKCRNAVAPLLEALAKIKGPEKLQRSYIEELSRSAESLAECPRPVITSCEGLGETLELDAATLWETVKSIRESITEKLFCGSVAHKICRIAGVYPRVTAVFLLKRLSRNSGDAQCISGKGWLDAVVNYGIAIAYWQRAERLVACSKDSGRRSDLLRELSNRGSHDEWDPINNPESLLLEVEQGILIRPVQQRVAAEMMSPPDEKNAVMQLNMGEGKSSVIVPIVASALGDGKRLVRIVVPKPQSKQMVHMLITKLGGLIGRQVFYLPLSRSVRLSPSQAKTVGDMIERCRLEGGILLVQPEHLLSFKLMGIENTLSDRQTDDLGRQLVNLYQKFEDASRDIVDESDENFSVKFELIYTMGTQGPIDMSPDRWLIVQELLRITLEVAREISAAATDTPTQGLLVEERGRARFPTIRILEESSGQSFVTAIAKRIFEAGLRGFPIHNQTEKMKKALLAYMLHENVDAETIAEVQDAEMGLFTADGTRNVLLLLRGLLAKGIINFALGQKRFRVNYGLAPDRQPATMLAVPYRAKDMPSPRSEFSHPDVIIFLTCLSYYYRGLSAAELFTTLEILGKSDQAEQEYELWVDAAVDLPDTLRHFSAINLKDKPQIESKIFPALRYSKPTIDLYLANVVFPKEMKQFPDKLSASGWDLAKQKPHPLTGFSGTNDSKHVLPLSVKPLDLPQQRHTNAVVLSCLLREENKVLELQDGLSRFSALTVKALLDAVTQSGESMRVILDVGAQIVECGNLELSRRWLELTPPTTTDAVIFFNGSDELSVVTRDGRIEHFLTSAFAAQTDRCLVFLDQAHTRGTDLRLPDSYRAAVTLGPGITKDTLVQGRTSDSHLAMVCQLTSIQPA
ncbi:hypothetical protein OQA88_8387 [Cercophora sp. LCS_1]